MTALAISVFLASLLGSMHCVGMCGAFVAFSVGGREGPGAWTRHVAYHGGRLLTYSLLGAAAGGLGAALDLGGAWFGIQRATLAVAGVAMVFFGVVTLLRLRGVRIASPGVPGVLQRMYGTGHALAMRLGPDKRALAIGLLSAFLPCGWLYAFVVTAAGTGSALFGTLAMALFWSGTLPVLVGLGVGVQRLSGPLRQRLPAFAAVALIVVGLVAVGGRFRVPALDLGSASMTPPASIEQATRQAAQLDASDATCHEPEP